VARDIPVLIVGGGLVGLSAAVFLSGFGVRPLVVERHSGTSRLPKGRGLDVRSMELLRTACLEDAIREAPPSVLTRYAEIARGSTLAGPESFRSTRPSADSSAGLSPCGPVMVDQNVLEPILLARARELGAEVRFETELVSFAQDGDGVRAMLRDRRTGTERTVGAQYLLAADGHDSRVRRQLGIGVRQLGGAEHFVNIPFEADLTVPLRGRRLALCYLDQPEPKTMLTRLERDGRWVLMVPYRPGRGESPADYTEARCLDLIRQAVGTDGVRARLITDLFGEDGTLSAWELACWVADEFERGRVLLAGDAVHVTPPAGGLGGNVGIQDAHNLAWKLAYAVRGLAGPGLLKTFSSERRPIAEAACDYSFRRQRSRTSGGGDSTVDLDPVTLALGFRYPVPGAAPDENGVFGPFVRPGDVGALPGTRAPHLPVKTGTAGGSTIDLFRDRFALLAGPAAGQWARAAQKAREDVGVPLAVHRIGVDVIDLEDRFCAAYGVGSPGAVLVRPDGVVCWRSGPDQAPDTRTVTGALRTALDLPRHPH
jgi:putative polyketide hydroxylase